MKKVIVKCKLKDKAAFEKKLSDIDLHFGDTIWQHDRVYVPRGYKPHCNYPRLVMRTEMHAVDQPAKYYLLQRRHIEGNDTDIINATAVADYPAMVNIIHQLGFTKLGEVSRRRKELQMGEGVTIFLDQVENISGCYAKMEAVLEEHETPRELREDLNKTFAVLDQKNIINQIYADLLEVKDIS